jgi:hypothetical protein
VRDTPERDTTNQTILREKANMVNSRGEKAAGGSSSPGYTYLRRARE